MLSLTCSLWPMEYICEHANVHICIYIYINITYANVTMVAPLCWPVGGCQAHVLKNNIIINNN